MRILLNPEYPEDSDALDKRIDKTISEIIEKYGTNILIISLGSPIKSTFKTLINYDGENFPSMCSLSKFSFNSGKWDLEIHDDSTHLSNPDTTRAAFYRARWKELAKSKELYRMKTYKYELHAHTVEVSSCAHEKARHMVNLYKKRGYQGIVITDHFHDEYIRSLGDIKWEDKIDRYHSGFREALDEGIEIGMDVLWGIELRFTDHENDYLVYGLDDAFLKGHENMHELTLPEFYNLVRGNDQILIFQAHPFRPGHFAADSNYIDGVEIFNGNPRHNSRNEKAQALANAQRLLCVSGSDFHREGDEATGGIVTSKRITSSIELIHALKKAERGSLLTRNIN